MDSTAGVNGRISWESERPDGSDHAHNENKVVGDGEPESSKHEHQFQKAIAAWRSRIPPLPVRWLKLLIPYTEIDLGDLVHELDSTAADIVANQRESLVQRKDLAQKTKDFRKLDDEAKLQEYKGLLKGVESAATLLFIPDFSC